MDEQKPNSNWFTRLCIIALALFVAWLIVVNFQDGPSPFSITGDLISLVVIVVVIILSESFNDISFGSILRLKRDVQRAEEEKKEAKAEVKELRSSLISLATNVHQSQVTTNISGLDLATLRKVFGVVEATPEDKEKESEEEEKELPTSPAPTRSTFISFEARQRLRNSLEDDLLRRFCAKYSISLLEVRREVKFEAGLEIVDPISTRNFIYDGYVRSGQKEFFLEVPSIGPSISAFSADRLYLAIAKVFFYRQIKKVDAELVLLCPVLPSEQDESLPRRPTATVLIQWFQPAISNNLLRIESFQLSKDEYEKIKVSAEGSK